jgi:hypothetical protein
MKSKMVKKAEAAKRLEEWQSIGLKDQIKALDFRLGKNIGAQKQRERITKLLEKKNEDS